MKLTVLIDNNTLIDRYFYGEPGVSYFIQDGNTSVLFDTGYSDAFIKNAYKMNLDLTSIDSVIISHGHIDHTWGLFHLIQLHSETALKNHNFRKPSLVAHPSAFMQKKVSEDEEIGSMIAEDTLSRHFNMTLSKEPLWLTDKLIFLGEIDRQNTFENKIPIGKTICNGKEIDDYLLDDSALVYKSQQGLVIITGCSHSGICNIIAHAKKVCRDDRIIDIIGGFHLLDAPLNTLSLTAEYIKQNNVRNLHAGHCTDLAAKIELSHSSNLKELGVGLVLEYQ